MLTTICALVAIAIGVASFVLVVTYHLRLR